MEAKHSPVAPAQINLARVHSASGSGSGSLPTISALTNRQIPASVEVVCGAVPGTLLVQRGKVLIDRGLPTEREVTPSEFEKLGGRGATKKWKQSIRVVVENGSKCVGEWLQEHGLEMRSNLLAVTMAHPKNSPAGKEEQKQLNYQGRELTIAYSLKMEDTENALEDQLGLGKVSLPPQASFGDREAGFAVLGNFINGKSNAAVHQGPPITASVYGCTVDLQLLYKEMKAGGGYDALQALPNGWQSLAHKLGLDTTATGIGVLKTVYERNLLRHERQERARSTTSDLHLAPSGDMADAAVNQQGLHVDASLLPHPIVCQEPSQLNSNLHRTHLWPAGPQQATGIQRTMDQDQQAGSRPPDYRSGDLHRTSSLQQHGMDLPPQSQTALQQTVNNLLHVQQQGEGTKMLRSTPFGIHVGGDSWPGPSGNGHTNTDYTGVPKHATLALAGHTDPPQISMTLPTNNSNATQFWSPLSSTKTGQMENGRVMAPVSGSTVLALPRSDACIPQRQVGQQMLGMNLSPHVYQRGGAPPSAALPQHFLGLQGHSDGYAVMQPVNVASGLQDSMDGWQHMKRQASDAGQVDYSRFQRPRN